MQGLFESSYFVIQEDLSPSGSAGDFSLTTRPSEFWRFSLSPSVCPCSFGAMFKLPLPPCINIVCSVNAPVVQITIDPNSTLGIAVYIYSNILHSMPLISHLIDTRANFFWASVPPSINRPQAGGNCIDISLTKIRLP